jgi:hypothetical protein
MRCPTGSRRNVLLSQSPRLAIACAGMLSTRGARILDQHSRLACRFTAQAPPRASSFTALHQPGQRDTDQLERDVDVRYALRLLGYVQGAGR